MDTYTILSLYSGGGGLDLGFRLAVRGARTVCYVERDAAAIALLVDHMQTGQLDDAPLWSDSGTFDGQPWRGKVDWIIGGFPCQPFSVAGKLSGTDDERWLWPHIERLVREIRPGGLFLENVPGLFHGGIEHVLGGLASLGYDAEWITVRASDVGATHRRERVFILAQRISTRRAQAGQRRDQYAGNEPETRCGELGRSDSEPRDALERGLRPEPGRDGRDVAHTRHGTGCTEQGQQHDAWRGVEAAGAGQPSAVDDVGDTDQQGLQERIEQPGMGRTESSRPARPFAWPPGPSDTDAWAAVLRERPDLAPAVDNPANGKRKGQQETAAIREQRISGLASQNDDGNREAIESEVRGMADGTPRGLARTDRLRILGNGVVPQQAALAFRELADRVSAVGM